MHVAASAVTVTFVISTPIAHEAGAGQVQRVVSVKYRYSQTETPSSLTQTIHGYGQVVCSRTSAYEHMRLSIVQ
jgi:hypothetical protein